MSKARRNSALDPRTGIEVYVTARDYLDWLTQGDIDARLLDVVSQVSRTDLLAGLATLGRGQVDLGIRHDFDSAFLELIAEPYRGRLEGLLADQRPGYARRRLFSRQGILIAARYVVLHGRDDVARDEGALDPLFAAGHLVHLVSVGMSAVSTGGALSPELFRHELFSQAHPTGDAIALYRRVWVDFEAEVLAKVPSLEPPLRLAARVLGAEVEDVFAVAFALFSQVISSEQPGPPYLSFESLSMFPREAVKAVVTYFAATPEDLAGRFDRPTGTGSWGVLPFVERPLLVLGEGLLVLDAPLLVDRVTAGLYWLVHDDQKLRGGNQARDRWAQAWASWWNAWQLACCGTAPAVAPLWRRTRLGFRSTEAGWAKYVMSPSSTVDESPCSRCSVARALCRRDTPPVTTVRRKTSRR